MSRWLLNFTPCKFHIYFHLFLFIIKHFKMSIRKITFHSPGMEKSCFPPVQSGKKSFSLSLSLSCSFFLNLSSWTQNYLCTFMWLSFGDNDWLRIFSFPLVSLEFFYILDIILANTRKRKKPSPKSLSPAGNNLKVVKSLFLYYSEYFWIKCFKSWSLEKIYMGSIIDTGYSLKL